MNKEATKYLNNLKRVTDTKHSTGILCPLDASFLYTNDNKLYMKTNNNDYIYQKELIQIIDIKDSVLGKYFDTGLVAPRKYAESLSYIPLHLNTQCIIVSKIQNSSDVSLINKIINETRYGKGDYDKIWVSDKTAQINQNIIIMNRRIGGWDGNKDAPVIELLGAGGHVPCLWNGTCFKAINAIDNLKKEFMEELKYNVTSSRLIYIGGFHNTVSNELVLLYMLYIDISDLVIIQNNALYNTSENINGIYIGDFSDIMRSYLINATHFAGGERAKQTNFPSQPMLMEKIKSILFN